MACAPVGWKQVVQQWQTVVYSWKVSMIKKCFRFWFINLSKWNSLWRWIWNAPKSYLYLKMETHCSCKEWPDKDLTWSRCSHRKDFRKSLPDHRTWNQPKIRLFQQAIAQNPKLWFNAKSALIFLPLLLYSVIHFLSKVSVSQWDHHFLQTFMVPRRWVLLTLVIPWILVCNNK